MVAALLHHTDIQSHEQDVSYSRRIDSGRIEKAETREVDQARKASTWARFWDALRDAFVMPHT